MREQANPAPVPMVAQRVAMGVILHSQRHIREVHAAITDRVLVGLPEAKAVLRRVAVAPLAGPGEALAFNDCTAHGGTCRARGERREDGSGREGATCCG